MTLRQWLRHMRQWWHMVITPPWFNDESHFWVGEMGSGESTCMICEATMFDPNDVNEGYDSGG